MFNCFLDLNVLGLCFSSSAHCLTNAESDRMSNAYKSKSRLPSWWGQVPKIHGNCIVHDSHTMHNLTQRYT